ncbi:pilus assembly protein Flp/PilA [Labrenzia sp. EL_208]|nr:pilus assembly protein Flp/PilA [Labrenzia sp. EL_132]MBG6231275.1 pilus assembly protein Flp/PilA [Labrenzia sp. EL_208]
MRNLINRFVKDESGATAIEYGLIAGLLSIVIIAAVSLAGTSLTAVFENIAGKLDESITTP